MLIVSSQWHLYQVAGPINDTLCFYVGGCRSLEVDTGVHYDLFSGDSVADKSVLHLSQV